MSDQLFVASDNAHYFGIFTKLFQSGIIDESNSSLYSGDFAEFYNSIANGMVRDIPYFQRLLTASTDNVLDLACGSGRIGIALAKAGFSVHGLELSNDMLKMADVLKSKESTEIQKRLSFSQGNMCNFSLEKKYELIILGVTSISLLTDLSQREALFGCVRNHLKPNGKFIFDIIDLNMDNWAQFDNYQDLIVSDCKTGQSFSIVGQRVFWDKQLIVYNIYHEKIAWDGCTSRKLATSSKVILEREGLIESMKKNGLTYIEDFKDEHQIYMISTLAECGEAI